MSFVSRVWNLCTDVLVIVYAYPVIWGVCTYVLAVLALRQFLLSIYWLIFKQLLIVFNKNYFDISEYLLYCIYVLFHWNDVVIWLLYLYILYYASLCDIWFLTIFSWCWHFFLFINDGPLGSFLQWLFDYLFLVCIHARFC